MLNCFHINRSTVAYWILGLCNNFGYVVMLSAAHDILARDKDEPHTTVLNEDRHCNYLSTGVILLADVLPSMMIKFAAPFLPLWMNIRMGLVVGTAALGFILVGMSQSLFVALLGVICTSFSSGIGESTLLSYTVFYKSRAIISAWSSGTGGAGFFGSLTYAGLIAIGIAPSTTLFLLLSVPALMAVSFWIILLSPEKTERILETMVPKPEEADEPVAPTEINNQSFLMRLKELPLALKYIIPLTLVYYFEYVINQGLFELSLIDNSFVDRSTQYRWYQVFYQIGVFISRSSISIIKVDKLWMLAVLQGVNVVYFTAEAIYKFTNNVLIVFAVILWEGLLGGTAYVNTFYKIQVEEEPQRREVLTGLVTISDSVGIALAGITAIPLHNKICTLPKF